MAVTQQQRIYGLIMSGHASRDVAYALNVDEKTVVLPVVQNLSFPQVTTQDQRIHDLASCGKVPRQIAFELGIAESVVLTSLQNLNVGPSGTGGAYSGNA
jgi:DNA-binding NarL/FixJ family response regulator